MIGAQVQVLGLLAVASLPEEQLPPEVAAGLPDILAAVLKLLIALREQEVSNQHCGFSNFSQNPLSPKWNQNGTMIR